MSRLIYCLLALVGAFAALMGAYMIELTLSGMTNASTNVERLILIGTGATFIVSGFAIFFGFGLLASDVRESR